MADAVDRMSPQQVYERFRPDPSFRDWRHEELGKAGFDLSTLKLPWLFFWSMNISVHADDFAAVGGFDERFREWGGEDVELGYRLHRRGVPLIADIRPWAIEHPHERDPDASMASAKRNALHILRSHADPAVELFWALFTRDDGNMWPAEDAYRDLLEWADEVAGLDVGPELDRGTPACLPAPGWRSSAAVRACPAAGCAAAWSTSTRGCWTPPPPTAALPPTTESASGPRCRTGRSTGS